MEKKVEVSEKSWVLTFLLALFLGWLGLDRFYTGRWISGLFKLLTMGGWGIWWIIDIILIVYGKTKDVKGNIIQPLTRKELR